MTTQDSGAMPARTGSRVAVDCLQSWQEPIGSYFDLTASTDRGAPFFGRLNTYQLGRCCIDRIDANRAQYQRGQGALAKAEAALLLIQIETGAIRVRQRGLGQQIAGNDGIVLLGNEPFTMEIMENGTRFVCLRSPIADVAARIVDLSMAVAKRLNMTQPAGILLSAYLSHLLEQSDLPTDVSFATLIASHLSDLLANLLAEETNNLTENAKTRHHTLRMHRKQAIKACIARDICDSSLRPDDVAKHVGISGRYLHKLLQEEGIMFSELLRHQRLHRAYQLLTHPDHLHSPIVKIAGEAGFNDFSYFKRRFRQYFNATPSDIRIRSQQRYSKLRKG